MSTSTIHYQGNLRTLATHTKSGNTTITDAPVDNNGKGDYFSPTDLVATALGSCAITIMGITANNHNIEFKDCDVSVIKTMAAEPRRISKIELTFEIVGSFTDKEKAILEKAALTCPVSKSLDPALEQKLTFNWKQ